MKQIRGCIWGTEDMMLEGRAGGFLFYCEDLNAHKGVMGSQNIGAVKTFRYHTEEETKVQKGTMTYLHLTHWAKKEETKSEFLSFPTCTALFVPCDAALGLLAKVYANLSVPGEIPLFFAPFALILSLCGQLQKEWVDLVETNNPGVKGVDVTKKLTRTPRTQ